MRKLYFAILISLFTLGLKAQPFGNEWINYGQTYYKIPVTKKGIHRLDSATLASAGFPISTTDPRNLQVFYRGIEQCLHIPGEGDGVLNASDYIEFYAEPNDGALDSSLYENGSNGHPNPYYSLFNDTAFYFITWNSSLSNLRYLVEVDVSFGAFTPSDYFFKEDVLYNGQTYYTGETFGGIDVSDAEFTSTEGWFFAAFGRGSVTSRAITTAGTYLSGPSTASLSVRVAGESNYATLSPDHHLRVAFGSYSKDSIYEGYQLNEFNFEVPVSDLGASTTNLTLSSINDLGDPSNPDRNALVYAHIRYPHIPNMEGKTSFDLLLPDNTGQTKAYLNMSNFNDQGANVLFYDLSNYRKIPVVKSGGFYKAIIPNSNSIKRCYMASENQVVNINTVLPAGVNGTFTNYDAGNPDSAFIIITHPSLMIEATNYKNYRSTDPNGGNHDVVLADINELYEQFGYGVNKSPLAIRNFANHAINNWQSKPQNLLLIGKSLHVTSFRKNTTNYANTLVPSTGYPSSDILLTAGLDGTQFEPAIPTGRIAARTPSDVTIYLDKVKDFEDNVAEPWMKRVLHFGGGTSASQQATFKAYLKNYEDIIEDTLFGGEVHTFLKTSSAPIQINTSDSLTNLIEGGVSLMTFFGHASGSGFDQSIDKPSNYNNKGKYPLLLANSCFAGDLHSGGYSSSEQFVLIQDKGVIGYIGSVSLGVIYALNNYSNPFYQHLSNKSYGSGIGHIMKQAITDAQGSGTDPFIKSVCLEMTLHGDPSISLNAHELPDYAITNADVYFDTETYVDSFIVYAGMTNIGYAIKDSFVVEVQRRFPNGDVESYLKRINAPYFKDTVSFTIPIDFARGVGLNKIKVTLDLYNDHAELSELNNSTNPDVDLLIAGGEVVPIYPYEYAVIPTTTVTLKASTANPLAQARNYIIEIDTTDEFNSPFKLSTTINSPGGVISWTPAITLTDSLVCFWRVSTDSIDSTGFHWRESSFQYIQGKRGWGQAHFFQFKKDAYQYVKHDRPSRQFIFVNDVKSIHAKDGIFPITPFNEIKYGINAANYHPWGCAWGGFNFAWIDPISGSFVPSVNQGGGVGQYDNKHCVPEDLEWFSFDSDSLQRARMRDFINLVPNGHYILAYSIDFNNVDFKTAILNDTLTYQAFESFGSSNIRTLADTVPYIIFGKKGDAIGTAQEVIGTSRYDFIQLQDTITTKWKEGFVESVKIGPALNWGSLHWRQSALESPSADSIILNVIGIDTAGNETVLAVFPPDSAEVLNLSSYANASTYPYLKLKAYVRDDSLTTSPQIDRWQVLYTPVPEAALNPPIGYDFYADTIQEGEELTLSIALENISEYDFADSILFTYWVIDKNRNRYELDSFLRGPAPFISGAVMIDTVSFSTIGYSGLNSFWLEANPVGNKYSQLEQYHFNNIVQIPFFVNGDEENPLLDVTFDGVHILNRDIVSPRTHIIMKLKDENQFLALNDTSDFAVFLKKPNDPQEEQIHFGTNMTFTPANLPDNSCQIDFTPGPLNDGIHKLIVQAQDRSKNQSGALDYEIEFEVVNKSSITEVMNYPNPFSTATRFVFTLTGSEVPSIFKIQILTVTGKVVREITQDELGPIHIGRNMTEYAWDGKDEFGDQLANGIYLYRVVTQINGESIEKRESGADEYFHKGFGKMYLMR